MSRPKLFRIIDKAVYDYKLIENGDRIAQAVIAQAIQADFVQKDELSNTERGAGGYGSTGIA